MAAVALLAAGGWLAGGAGWIHAKAGVAQWLIAQAWSRNVADGGTGARPWSWADTTPVARVEFVRQRESMVVLAGDSGRVLAFGPGHRTGTALPGEPGNSVVAAHRDTHFRVLGRVGVGDPIRIETVDGRSVVYRVDRLDVVDERDASVLAQDGPDRLTLVTCWPLDAVVPGGPERLVVVASRLDAGAPRRAVLGG